MAQMMFLRTISPDLDDAVPAAGAGSRPQGPKVYSTDLEKVKHALGDQVYEDMLAAGYKILWNRCAGSWRGYYGSKYIIGSASTVKRYGSDDIAIVSCHASLGIESDRT